MHDAGRLVRQARRAANLSQRELASRAGVHQPAVAAIESDERDTRVDQLGRLLAAADRRIIAIPTSTASASEIADELYQIRRTSAAGHRLDDRAFRILLGFNDRLSEADRATRVVLCVTPPASSGDMRFDATLAAIVEHRLRSDRLPVPAWVDDPGRVLVEPWSPSRYVDTDTAEIPAAFRRRNVLLAASELASV